MTQTYEKLYHRDSNENLRVWWLERDGDHYRTHAGVDGGKIVISDWKRADPKNVGRSNGTSGDEQAELEIQSLYRSKLERKYSTDSKTASRRNFVEPQLANKFGPKFLKKKMFYWHQQPKLDGIRALVDGATAMSRSGKPFITVQHIIDELAVVCAAYNITLDGELYNHDLKDDFETIQSFVKKQKLSTIPEPTMEDIRNMVEFHVYDVIVHDDESMSFVDREKFLKSEIFGNANLCLEKIKFVESKPIFLDIDDLEEAHTEHLENGYEGIMLRNPLSPYTFGRSDNLLKHKTFIDEEFEIVSIGQGKGNWANAAKTAEVKTHDGVISSVGIKGPYPRLVKVLENKEEYIGKLATVAFQGYTKSGKLRFGRIKAFYDDGRDS